LILVTGAAGFIGFHVAQRLLARGELVLGLDNLNAYYDPKLKEARLNLLQRERNFLFERCDIADRAALAAAWARHPINRVVHLAAQAGVRYSITHPHEYVEANIVGFLNLLELLRGRPPLHAVYASSSSVYGANRKQPFAEGDRVERPVSLYAATKRADELIAHVYAASYGLTLTGLRLFTVYGPWGRPDMAVFKFTQAMLAGDAIDVYNYGRMARDFTFVDDVADGILRVLDRVPRTDEGGVPHRIFNMGNSRSEPLLRFIEVLGSALGRKPRINLLPMQLGDVPETAADLASLSEEFGWVPDTPIEAGLQSFVEWYLGHYDSQQSKQ
jgi:UDP-glucuronate 4-epimerase